jgi:ppGpp synthetase/RelA/SpoT-type nucleotidyltranferase
MVLAVQAFRNDHRSVIGEDEDDPWLAEMAWAVPQHSKNQVDRAGVVLASEQEVSTEQLAWAYDILNNWRASHSFPLNNFQNNLRAKSKNIQSGAIVVQRIKRLESIVRKLRREQTSALRLSQMQDIGGCRVILKNMGNVSKLVASYKRSTFNHKLKGEKDYISSPKPDGYRGIHLIYLYQSLSNQIIAYDKLRIEVQIRTSLQHAWATAVEAVGAFTRQALKSDQGDQDWLRLFALMGSVIALIEKSPLVPCTPSDPKQLRQEIIDVASRLNAVRVMQAHRSTLNFVGSLKQKGHTYLLVHYDYGANIVHASPYGAKDSQAANLAYTEKEKIKKEGDNIVLVKVDSLRSLTKAYPNFFFDTGQFTTILQAILTANASQLPSAAAAALFF